MTYDIERTNEPPHPDSALPRVFLREVGWRVSMKVGSEKVFCYQMAPGDDAYHRLLDGEIFVFHGEEKLCLPCAERRGLIVFESRPLREKPAGIEIAAPLELSEYELS